MVLVHGLLVILNSRCFLSVEVRWSVGMCTMGESILASYVEISGQMSRRHGKKRHGGKQGTSEIFTNFARFELAVGSCSFIKKK